MIALVASGGEIGTRAGVALALIGQPQSPWPELNRAERAAIISWARSKDPLSMIAGKALSWRTQASGELMTCRCLSLNEVRAQTLLPMYFSLINIWWTVPCDHGR